MRRKKATRKRTPTPRITIKRDRHGFVDSVSNPLGNKGTAYIVQRDGPTGFTIVTAQGRKLGFARKENVAFMKALKMGYRKVVSRD